MKYKLIVIFMMITVCLLANSVFSFKGMPIEYYGNDVYGMGMGETGTADLFRINPNLHNPSIAATTNNVLFSTGASLGYMWYKDSNKNEFRDDGLYLPYFTLTVPVANNRFAFSYNSVASGNIKNTIMREFPTFNDTLQYSEVNRLSTSLYKADIAYALKSSIINFGISLNYYLGHRIQYWKIDFEDTDYQDTKYEIEKIYKNPGFTLGFSKKIRNFSLGAAYSTHAKLEGDTFYKYGHVPYADTLDLKDNYLFEVPAQLSGGVTLKLLAKYKASLDGYYQMWNDTDAYEKNTLKLGLGLAYDPLSGYGSWYEKIPVRLGAYYRELPFEVNNQKIIEKAVTFGTSVPLKSPNKKIEFAVSFISRGDIDKHGLSENSLMFSFGITGFDVFNKRVKKIGHREIPKADKDR
ncbi:MAG: hypothetical protein K9N07_00860 [Candidatus Cloacimonetes bacterium]|nr:hypothetical protein [Candidatus Cloacimonadota bacterium]MCF8396306.1 hypothetical protein [Melioribacteraceae bacterium]